MDTAIVLGILTLLTTILGFIYTWFKDARDRKWRIEDEAMKSQHLAAQDSALEANSASIQAGTQAANKAYTEANMVNEKIANLQEELRKANAARELLDTQSKAK